MPTAASESTLAAAFGVSGTMSSRKGLFPVSPLTMIYRRMLTPDDTLLSAIGLQAGIALAERTVSLEEGQWVTLNSSGNAIVADSGSGGGATGLAWPVWSGGDRLDMKGGIAVLHGPFVADTSYFDDGGTYAAGTLLQVATGTKTVQGTAGKTGALTSIVPSTVAHLMTVVARVEKAPFGTSSDTPSGVMRIHRV